MNKKLLVIVLILVSISLVGCQSKEDKLIQEIDELKVSAENYYNRGDLDNAIKLYEKILDLKEDTENRKYIDELLIEKKALNTTKSFLNAMDELRYNLDSIHNMTELSEFMMGIKVNFDDLEKINTSKDTEIMNFVKKLRTNEQYIYLKELYDNDSIKNAQHNADLSRILDKSLGGIDLTYADRLGFESTMDIIELCLRHIPKELPAKFNN